MTMGRYSRKQSACAGKESAEDFGKRREDQREISAHLQLNYENTPPCGCAGVTFFSLIRPLHEPFVCFPIIWITPFNPIMQIPCADAGGFCILFSPSAGVLYIIFYFHYTKILWSFRSYQLPKTI